MKKLLSITLIIVTAFTITSCKKENKETVTEDKKPQVTNTKPPKKKTPKTDPLKIIEQAPEGTTAKTVVDRYFKEIGGADKARKVNTLLIKSYAKDTPTRTFNFITKYKNPNKFYEETSEEGEVFSKLGFNGKSGYSFYEGEIATLAEEENQEFKKVERYIFPDFNYAKGTLKGIADVKGEKCYVIDYKGSNVYYSIDTGLRVVVIEFEKDEEGKTVIALKKYTSNYKEVDGLKFPFKLRDARPNVRVAKSDITEIIVNKNVTDKDFEQ